MREIKFRGERESGYVYGGSDGKSIFIRGLPWYAENIVQLIGVDMDNVEVYENDMIKEVSYVDDDGAIYEVLDARPRRATFSDYDAINEGKVIKCVK